MVAGVALTLGTMAGWAYGVTGNSGHSQDPQVYMTTHSSGGTDQTTGSGETTTTEVSEGTTVPDQTTTTEAGHETTTTEPGGTTTTVPEETTTTRPEGTTTTVPAKSGEEETTTTVAEGGSSMSNPQRCRPPGHTSGNLPHGRAGNPAHVPNCRWGR